MEHDFSELHVDMALQEQLRINSEKCITCKLCQKECKFLRRYGKPKDIADSYDPSNKIHQGMPFECSLCQLCASVCPIKINPSLMFLEMRRETVRQGSGDYPEHAAILGYEKRGTSNRYTYCAGCVNSLNPLTPTSHILDLIYEPQKTMSGKVKVSKSPFTYMNRLRLKNPLKNTVPTRISRERTFTVEEEKGEKGLFKRILLYLLYL